MSCYSAGAHARVAAIKKLKGWCNLKKIVSIALCLLLIFSLAAPAFADSSPNVGLTSTIEHGKGRIIGSNVAFRRSAGLGGEIIGYFQQNEIVQVIAWHAGTVDGYQWTYVYARGAYGFVATQYITSVL